MTRTRNKTKNMGLESSEGTSIKPSDVTIRVSVKNSILTTGSGSSSNISHREDGDRIKADIFAHVVDHPVSKKVKYCI